MNVTRELFVCSNIEHFKGIIKGERVHLFPLYNALSVITISDQGNSYSPVVQVG